VLSPSPVPTPLTATSSAAAPSPSLAIAPTPVPAPAPVSARVPIPALAPAFVPGPASAPTSTLEPGHLHEAAPINRPTAAQEDDDQEHTSAETVSLSGQTGENIVIDDDEGGEEGVASLSTAPQGNQLRAASPAPLPLASSNQERDSDARVADVRRAIEVSMRSVFGAVLGIRVPVTSARKATPAVQLSRTAAVNPAILTVDVLASSPGHLDLPARHLQQSRSNVAKSEEGATSGSPVSALAGAAASLPPPASADERVWSRRSGSFTTKAAVDAADEFEAVAAATLFRAGPLSPSALSVAQTVISPVTDQSRGDGGVESTVISDVSGGVTALSPSLYVNESVRSEASDSSSSSNKISMTAEAGAVPPLTQSARPGPTDDDDGVESSYPRTVRAEKQDEDVLLDV
jgi:hypothetical protein